jgi:hypothetical protein
MAKLDDASATRSLPLTTIAKPMNRLRRAALPKGRGRPKDRKMTQDEMIEWFNAAPEGSRHQRTLWAARKIARLTGVTEGGAYQALLIALIEAERLDPRDHHHPT